MISLPSLLLLMMVCKSHCVEVKCKNRGSVTAVETNIYSHPKYCCQMHVELTKLIQMHVRQPEEPSNCSFRCYIRSHDNSTRNGPAKGLYCIYWKDFPAKNAKDVGYSGCPSKLSVYNDYSTIKGSCGQNPGQTKCQKYHNRMPSPPRGERPKGSLLDSLVYYCYRKCVDFRTGKKSDCIRNDHTCRQEITYAGQMSVDTGSYFCEVPCQCN